MKESHFFGMYSLSATRKTPCRIIKRESKNTYIRTFLQKDIVFTIELSNGTIIRNVHHKHLRPGSKNLFDNGRDNTISNEKFSTSSEPVRSDNNRFDSALYLDNKYQNVLEVCFKMNLI